MASDHRIGDGETRTIAPARLMPSDDCRTSDHFGTYCLGLGSSRDQLGHLR